MTSGRQEAEGASIEVGGMLSKKDREGRMAAAATRLVLKLHGRNSKFRFCTNEN